MPTYKTFDEFWAGEWTPTTQPAAFDLAMRELSEKGWNACKESGLKFADYWARDWQATNQPAVFDITMRHLAEQAWLAREASELALNSSVPEPDWRAEVTALLDATPGAVRCREGGGSEDLLASLAINYTKLLQLLPPEEKYPSPR